MVHGARQSPPAVRSVCIAFTSGCPRAEMDTSVLFRYFQANGWRIEQAIGRADLVVVSACGVDAHAEDRNFELLKIADKKRKAGSRLSFWGVWRGSTPRVSAGNSTRCWFLPPASTPWMRSSPRASPSAACRTPIAIEPDLRQAKRCFGIGTACRCSSRLSWSFRQKAAWELRQAAGRALRSTARTRLQAAHRQRLPRRMQLLRHPLRHRTASLQTVDAVLAEFEAGLQQGFRTIDLVADDVGAYGQDSGSDFVELLRRLVSRDADFVLELNDVNPRWIVQYSEQLAALWSQSAGSASDACWFPCNRAVRRSCG